MNDAELCKEVLKYVHGAFAKLETFEDKLHSQEGKPERESEESWSTPIIHEKRPRFQTFPALLFPLIEV